MKYILILIITTFLTDFILSHFICNSKCFFRNLFPSKAKVGKMRQKYTKYDGYKDICGQIHGQNLMKR